MPEELAIVLIVLVVIGWIIYAVISGIATATRNAHNHFNRAVSDRRQRKYLKKRALIAPSIRIFLPSELENAKAELEAVVTNFEQQRKKSVWTPERPTWKRIEFEPHNFPNQSQATSSLNVSEIKQLLQPETVPWHVQEARLLSRQCCYSESLSSVRRRSVHEYEIPPLSLAPAVFSVDGASIKEKSVSAFFGKERADVIAYNKQRDELLAWHEALAAEITSWNRDEHARAAHYYDECDKELRQEALKFQEHASRFETQCYQQRADFSQILQGFQTRSKAFVLRRIEFILSSLHLPTSVPRFWKLDYDSQEQILIVEIALPNVAHELPLKTVQQRAGPVLKPLNQSERRELVPQFQPAMLLRVAYEIFRNDQAETIKLLVLNGWVDFIDPKTGLDSRAYVASLVVSREQIVELDITKIDPLSAFTALKGKSSGKLLEIIPIEPSLNLDRADARFVDAKAVLDSLGSTTNLAAMEWQDFEHLIRELFEREFAERGAEVKITQTSRDRGVDAVVFNPDPIQGGKYIIQAKRYTNTVDVSAVRDLCAVVRKEGASRGILVTTSSYGADAYAFANNEPITLLSGAQLLGLLEKHGYNFRIDLAEARRLRTSGSVA